MANRKLKSCSATSLLLVLVLVGCGPKSESRVDSAPPAAVVIHSATYSAPPAGWDELTSESPAISIYVPKGWTPTNAASNPSASHGAVAIASASAPRDSQGRTKNVTVQILPPVGAVVDDAGLKEFANGQVAAVPGTKLLNATVADLPVGLAFRLELEVPMGPVLEHHVVYALPDRDHVFEIQYAAVKGDKTLGALESKSIATFRVKG